MNESIELRCQMIRKGLTQEELAAAIGRTGAYAGTRLHGHRPWTIDEVYAICDLLGIPYEEIPIYFPPNKKKEGARGA